MKMIMKKLWNMENLKKVMEFWDQSWSFNIFALFWPNLFLKYCINLKSAFSDIFSKMTPKQNACQEIVMENREMLMEKSWKKVMDKKFAKSVGTL